MYSTYKLKNGLTVLMVPNPASQAVIVDAFVKVGSRQEDKRVNGISHFLEHLNFKGTRKYPTARKLSEAIDAVGGVFNANTGKEHTQYYTLVASKKLDLAFDVVTDLFLYPKFRLNEIEREKGVIIEEINMYLDDPSRHVLDMVEEAMWVNHSLGRYIIGTPQNIRDLTKQDILDYRRTHYFPENTIVAVGGKFEEEQVVKLVKKHWSNYEGVGHVPTVLPTEKAKQKLVVLQSKKTNQAHFAMGFRSLPREDERNHALQVLAAVLGGGMSSRLFVEVREKRGLAYYVQALSENYQDTGTFLARAGVEIKNIDMALQVVAAELKKVKRNGIPALEIKKAKDYLKGRVALSLEDTESKLAWYLEELAFAKKVEEPSVWMKKIEKVSAQDIKRIAREILSPKRLSLAVVGPYGVKHQNKFAQIVSKI